MQLIMREISDVHVDTYTCFLKVTSVEWKAFTKLQKPNLWSMIFQFVCRDSGVTFFVAFENMRINSPICIACLLKVSLAQMPENILRTRDCSHFCSRKCLTATLMGHPQMNQITQSCHNVSKACNPNVGNPVEVTWRKESRAQTHTGSSQPTPQVDQECDLESEAESVFLTGGCTAD